MVTMTQEMKLKLKKSLVNHEGYKKAPYLDTIGKITIGIGYNLSDRGIDDDWINSQYEKDIEYFYKKLCTFTWFKDLNEDRQIALTDMCFMGWNKFLEFNKLILALSNHDYEIASVEMLNSKWATEVKERAITLSKVMLTGIYTI